MRSYNELNNKERASLRQVGDNKDFVSYLTSTAEELVGSLVTTVDVNEIIRLQGKLQQISTLLENLKG